MKSMLSSFDRMLLNEYEQVRIEHLTERYRNARKRSEARLAHKEAEHIRSKHGYSGGSNGSRYIRIKETKIRVLRQSEGT